MLWMVRLKRRYKKISLKEMSKYKIDDYKKASDPSKFGKSFQQPKIPSIPSGKI